MSMGLQLFELIKNDLEPFVDTLFNGVEGLDYVVCQECKQRMKQIQYRHLSCRHNMTLLEYIKKYSPKQLIAEKYKNTKKSMVY